MYELPTLIFADVITNCLVGVLAFALGVNYIERKSQRLIEDLRKHLNNAQEAINLIQSRLHNQKQAHQKRLSDVIRAYTEECSLMSANLDATINRLEHGIKNIRDNQKVLKSRMMQGVKYVEKEQ